MSKDRSYIRKKIESDRASDPAFADAYDEVVFAENLVERRVALDLTQSDVARIMRTTQSHVARLEDAPFQVKTETLLRYLRALKVENPIQIPKLAKGVEKSSRTRGSYKKTPAVREDGTDYGHD